MNARKNAKPASNRGMLQELIGKTATVKTVREADGTTKVTGLKLHDPVNHPSHYTQGKVECIDAIESMIGPAAFLGFLRGQVVKYTWRMEHKGGKQDALKAQWYNNLLIAKLEEYANAGPR